MARANVIAARFEDDAARFAAELDGIAVTRRLSAAANSELRRDVASLLSQSQLSRRQQERFLIRTRRHRATWRGSGKRCGTPILSDAAVDEVQLLLQLGRSASIIRRWCASSGPRMRATWPGSNAATGRICWAAREALEEAELRKALPKGPREQFADDVAELRRLGFSKEEAIKLAGKKPQFGGK